MKPESPEHATGDSEPPRIIPSEDILQGHHEVWIEHGDKMYRLRATSNGKLYLSK